MWSAAELTYKAFQDLCARIKVNTNGRLVIEPFAAGAVTGVFEIPRRGRAQAFSGTLVVARLFLGQGCRIGRHQRFRVRLQHPYQADAWFHHRGGLEMLREAYAK